MAETMSSQLLILRAIQHDVQERCPHVRFEEMSRNLGCAADVFFSKEVGSIHTYKHGFGLQVVGDRIRIVPGSLLRGRLVTGDLEYELADPQSIEKLLELIEDCRRDTTSAP